MRIQRPLTLNLPPVRPPRPRRPAPSARGRGSLPLQAASGSVSAGGRAPWRSVCARGPVSSSAGIRSRAGGVFVVRGYEFFSNRVVASRSGGKGRGDSRREGAGAWRRVPGQDLRSGRVMEAGEKLQLRVGLPPCGVIPAAPRPQVLSPLTPVPLRPLVSGPGWVSATSVASAVCLSSGDVEPGKLLFRLVLCWVKAVVAPNPVYSVYLACFVSVCDQNLPSPRCWLKLEAE